MIAFNHEETAEHRNTHDGRQWVPLDNPHTTRLIPCKDPAHSSRGCSTCHGYGLLEYDTLTGDLAPCTLTQDDDPWFNAERRRQREAEAGDPYAAGEEGGR